MGTRLQQHRGTAAAWASANTVLAAGEIGFETDTGIMKIGDGTTAWNSLTNVYQKKATNDAQYADSSGDTFTGVLRMSGTNPVRFMGGVSDSATNDTYVYVNPTGGRIRIVAPDLSTRRPMDVGDVDAARIDGTSIYDNGNRVYSVGNPPPATSSFGFAEVFLHGGG